MTVQNYSKNTIKKQYSCSFQYMGTCSVSILSTEKLVVRKMPHNHFYCFEQVQIRYQFNPKSGYTLGLNCYFSNTQSAVIQYIKKSFFLILRKILTFQQFIFTQRMLQFFVWVSVSCWLRQCMFFFFNLVQGVNGSIQQQEK